MKRQQIQILIASLALTLSAPSFADHDEHRGHRHRHERQHDYYQEGYRNSPCRVEGWYDRHGYYRERQVCQESRAFIPAPAVYLQPPSLIIQAPSIFIR